MTWTITRQDEDEWLMAHGRASYLWGPKSPGPESGLYHGTSAIRLRAAYWDGVEIVRCGHCFTLVNARSDDSIATGWQAGGGHAMESDCLATTWIVGGRAAELGVGASDGGDTLGLRYATILYTNHPGADPRGPGRDLQLGSQEHEYEFAADGSITGRFRVRYDLEGAIIHKHFELMASFWPAYSGGGAELLRFSTGRTIDLTIAPASAWPDTELADWVEAESATLGCAWRWTPQPTTGYPGPPAAMQPNTRPGDVAKVYRRARLGEHVVAAGQVVDLESTLVPREI
jgi:hypothetical protein